MCTLESYTISTWNVRSACNKLVDIIQYLGDQCPDFLLLSETWFPEAIPNKCDPFSAQIKELLKSEQIEYKFHSKERTNGKRGGGVAILSKSDIPLQRYRFPGSSKSLF